MRVKKFDLVKCMWWYQKVRNKLRTLSGALPLTFRAKAGILKNYRIYGDTVNGESVGDRTGNLFDENYPRINDRTIYRAIYVGTGFFTLSSDIPIFFNTANLFLLSGNVSSGALSSVNGVGYGVPRSAESIDGYITIGYRNYYDVDPRDYNVMLNSGTNPLPYEPYGYKVPVTVSNGTDTLTTPIYLPEQIKKVGDEAEYIDFGEQKQHRVRKNLWPGVVEQGSVSTIGNYADALDRIRSKNISLSPGTYTISCNLGIRCIFAYNNSEKVSCVVDSGGRAIYRNTFTVPSGANNVSVGLRAFDASGASMDTVKPSDFKWGQIEKGSEATTYEPYIENTDLDVTLPELPTLSGTNTLSVGTEVQPSSVEIKGRIKAIDD